MILFHFVWARRKKREDPASDSLPTRVFHAVSCSLQGRGKRRPSDHKEISPLRFGFFEKPHLAAGEKSRASFLRREHPPDDSTNRIDRQGFAGEILAAGKTERSRRQDFRRGASLFPEPSSTVASSVPGSSFFIPHKMESI
jgi:hypothetical protein